MQMTVMTETREWFDEWFDSPYYHILYKDRDQVEAQIFIDNLAKYLQLTPQDEILDLACGKGRHAIYLHKLGFCVTGIDLSTQNIEFANRFARRYGDDRLKFYEHDMREVFLEDEFDYILNIFTSFGYFDKAGENRKVIHSAAAGLKKGGKLVIDFFNTRQVLDNLVSFERKIVEGINFTIHREFDNGFVVKHIAFQDKGKDYHFEEKVKGVTRADFLRYFQSADLKVVDFFGDYELNKYNPQTSDRMIFIVEK